MPVSFKVFLENQKRTTWQNYQLNECYQKCVNTLAERVKNNNWNRKVTPFHLLSSDDLKTLFTGSYQSVSYLVEIIDENGSILVSTLKTKPEIVQLKWGQGINSKMCPRYLHYNSNSSGMDGIVAVTVQMIIEQLVLLLMYHCCYLLLITWQIFIKNYMAHRSSYKLFNFEEIEPVTEEDSDEDKYKF